MKAYTYDELCAMQGKATDKHAQRLTAPEIALLQAQVKNWQISEVDGVLQLQRHFSVADFVAAMKFAALITEIAEANDHHPKLVLEYGSVTVSWWSHSIAGLHLNDFAAAAKTDQAFSNP